MSNKTAFYIGLRLLWRDVCIVSHINSVYMCCSHVHRVSTSVMQCYETSARLPQPWWWHVHWVLPVSEITCNYFSRPVIFTHATLHVLARVQTVAWCLSVCVFHKSSLRMIGSSWFWHGAFFDLSYTVLLGNSGTYKVRVLLSGTSFQTRTFSPRHIDRRNVLST